MFKKIYTRVTHQSKTLSFYFGMKTTLTPIFENFVQTDKANLINYNLVCVYTHSKFQDMKISLSVSYKILKNWI